MSFHAWEMLSESIRAENLRGADSSSRAVRKNRGESTIPMAMQRYCQEILDPSCELSVYTSPFRNPSSDLVVYLCLDNVTHFQANELLTLAHLPRLAILELIVREPSNEAISDRMIKGWSESSCEGGPPFPLLQVLKITSLEHAVSESSLHAVLQFPRLQIFDVTALPARRWRNARSIAASYGWKVTSPETSSLFVSYAEAFLDGHIEVKMTDIEELRPLFDDDRERIDLVHDPRSPLCQGEGGDEEPGVTSYLDEGWRALLQGVHRLTAADPENCRESRDSRRPQAVMSDNDAFWFLALLDQKKACVRTSPPLQGKVAGITLKQERVVCLRLRKPPSSAEHGRFSPVERLIFSRTSRCFTSEGAGTGSVDERPRKRQRNRPELRTLLASLGVPQGGPM